MSEKYYNRMIVPPYISYTNDTQNVLNVLGDVKYFSGKQGISTPILLDVLLHKSESWDKFVDFMYDPPLDLFKDYSRWFSGAILYPFDVNHWKTLEGLSRMTENAVSYDTATNLDFKMESINTAKTLYILCAEKIERQFNNFADYNGYTSLEIFLPFFGFISVDINQVLDKYLCVYASLDVAYSTLTYYVGYSTHNYVYPNNPYVYVSSDNDLQLQNFVLLSKHNCQIGVEIPINYTNNAEIKRNVALGAIKAVSTLASIGVSASVGGFTTTTSSIVDAVSAHQEVNPSTNRLRTISKDIDKSKTIKTAEYGSYKAHIINEVFGNSVDALSNMWFKVGSDKSGSVTDGLSTSPYIWIVRRTPKIVPTNSDYNHLFGKPLGKAIKLNELSGYTEISSIHFENENFGSCTSTEYAMIEQIFTNGVILPEPTVINFKVNTDEYKADKDMVWIDWISSAYNTNNYYSATLKVNGVTRGVVVVVKSGNDYVVVTDNGIPVTPSQYIISGGEYGTTVLTQDITFTVNSTTYRTDEDMYWIEWISSDYNTNNYYSSTITSGGVQYDVVTVSTDGDNYTVVTYNGTPVTPSQLIVANAVYGTTVLTKDSDSVVGTWYFNSDVDKTTEDINLEFYFIKNGTSYSLIGLFATAEGNLGYKLADGGVYWAKYNGVWDNAYRTIYVTKDSLTSAYGKFWIKTNATKQ